MIRQVVWNTSKVEEVKEKISNGFIVKRIDSPFFEGNVGLRRAGITFRATQHEIDEYIKCKSDIHYFSENYCWVKGEKGEPVKLVLRDYQVDILDNFFEDRFNILMASRQIGKCFSFNTLCVNSLNEEIRIGKLYYSLLSKHRKLTLLEQIKIKLYDILFIFEKH